MANLLVGCTLLYLVPLLLTQSAMGQGLSNLRWIGLGVASAVGLFVWLAARRRPITGDTATIALGIYLACTGISVVFAEDWLFSFFRWGSHALMLLLFHLFLREVVSVSQVTGLTWAVKIGLGVSLPILLLKSGLAPTADAPSQVRYINPNALGHLAAVSGLLFLHGAAVSRSYALRNGQTLMAILSFLVIWQSGARSSFAAVAVGLFLLVKYYRSFFSGWVIVGLAVLMLSGIIAPSLSQGIEGFILKDKSAELEFTAGNVVRSRTEIWQDSWNGFKARPMFGWGFGGHAGIEGNWRLSGTALGYTYRDWVNDTLFLLESAGLVGLIGFVVLVVSLLRYRPPLIGGIESNDLVKQIYDYNVLYSVMVVSLLALFQLDDTAMAAGNFPSAMLWLSAGLAAAMHSELVRICGAASAATSRLGGRA